MDGATGSRQKKEKGSECMGGEGVAATRRAGTDQVSGGGGRRGVAPPIQLKVIRTGGPSFRLLWLLILCFSSFSWVPVPHY